VKNTLELASTFAQENVIADCLVAKHARFAVGRDLTEADQCQLRNIRKKLFQGNSSKPTYSDLVKELALSAVFLEK
jgi:hypothetical protein